MRKITIFTSALLVLLILLTGCAKRVKITVNDAGIKTEYDALTEMTVGEFLEVQEISIGEKDEVEPPEDTVIDENTKDVLIKRYAKVKVQKKSDVKEVELVGGTVREAVDKSGFKIEEGEELELNENDYLKDGMIIRIVREATVTLTIDGKSKDFKTRTVTVDEFLRQKNLNIDKDDEISEDLDAFIEDGMKITVKRVEYKEETRKESIEFDTVEQDDDSMYEGEHKVIQEGANGEKSVEYKVKYVDGKEESKEKLSEKVTKEPVNKIVANGTKKSYDKYIGTWSNIDSTFMGYTVTIASISGGSADVYLARTAAMGEYTVTTPLISGTLSDMTINCSYTDSYGNSGYASIYLNGDTVGVDFTISDYADPSVYPLEGGGDLSKQSSSVTAPFG